MNIERIKALNEVITVAISMYENSGDGVTTYAEDSEADHGDGQQVGREYTCKNIMRACADKIRKSL